MLATPLGLGASAVVEARSGPRSSGRDGSNPSLTADGGVDGGFAALVLSVAVVPVGEDDVVVAPAPGGTSLPPPFTVTATSTNDRRSMTEADPVCRRLW